MSDALPLPPRPNLEQYRKLAKDLQRACKSGEANAIRDWAARWIETLSRLQKVATGEHRRKMNYAAEQMQRRWFKLQQTNERAARCVLADAQFFVARSHGFASWPRFAKHLEGLARAGSPVATYEAAVEAIVDGDLAVLKRLLRRNPELARTRSMRAHRSTLLHYVSANGVEDFRQRTPMNIVEITRLLLNAGADVNAESDAYGGRSTALGLTATSCHPQAAGVQLPLMELLIDHGAIIDGPDSGSAVNACLHNGRGEAAKFFADRGAQLDLEGAAGVGRLDVVGSFFTEDGSLKSTTTEQQMKDGFAWACEFGRPSVVEYLLQRGMKVDERLKHDGESGLHWAAYEGHVDVVKLLLDHGAPVDMRDESYDGTPLGWALYGWGAPERRGGPSYYEVVRLLIQHGAKLDPDWYEDDEDRQEARAKLRSDPQMVAALGDEMF